MKQILNLKNIMLVVFVHEGEQVLQKKRRYIGSHEDADAECYYTLGSWLS